MLRIEAGYASKSDRTDLYRTVPQEEHAEKLVTESCQLFFDGVKILTYIAKVPMEDLRKAVLAIDNIYANRRQSGVPSKSRTFGFMPRMPVQQRDYCAASSLHREYPESKEVLHLYAKQFSDLLNAHHPEQHALSTQAVATCRPEWVMPGSVFTSGIINQDNPLQYHYDAGNFEDTFSVMAVFKEQVAGGHLVLPEFGIKLGCQDSSILIFNGQAELHGVSPIRKTAPGAYRYSIVYYSLENICKCGTPKEELRRAQVSRTAVEMKRAGK